MVPFSKWTVKFEKNEETLSAVEKEENWSDWEIGQKSRRQEIDRKNW